ELSLVEILCILPLPLTTIKSEPLTVRTTRLRPEILSRPVSLWRVFENFLEYLIELDDGSDLTVVVVVGYLHFEKIIIEIGRVVSSTYYPFTRTSPFDG